MKKDLHPAEYRYVVFEDLSNGFRILTRSTIKADETIKWEDGNEYPLVKVHITSASHPFYTGQEKLLDMEGRVDKFKARTAAREAHKERLTNAAKKKAKVRTKVRPTVQKIGATSPKPQAKKPAADKPAE